MSMNEDRFAGTGKELGGHVERGFATGDGKTELEESRQPMPPRMFMDRRRKQPRTRMGKRKRPLAMRQGRCRHTLRRGKSFCGTIESRPYTSVAVALRPRLVYRP